MGFDSFQIFLRQPPPFGLILDAARPHSATTRHTTWSAFSCSREFTARLGRGHVHGEAAIPIERTIKLADISVSEKRNPSFSRWLSASGPSEVVRRPRTCMPRRRAWSLRDRYYSGFR